MIYLKLWEKILEELNEHEFKILKKTIQDMHGSYHCPWFSISQDNNLKFYFRLRGCLNMKIYQVSPPDYISKKIYEEELTPKIVDAVTNKLLELKKRVDYKQKHFRI